MHQLRDAIRAQKMASAATVDFEVAYTDDHFSDDSVKIYSRHVASAFNGDKLLTKSHVSVDGAVDPALYQSYLHTPTGSIQYSAHGGARIRPDESGPFLEEPGYDSRPSAWQKVAGNSLDNVLAIQEKHPEGVTVETLGESIVINAGTTADHLMLKLDTRGIIKVTDWELREINPSNGGGSTNTYHAQWQKIGDNWYIKSATLEDQARVAEIDGKKLSIPKNINRKWQVQVASFAEQNPPDGSFFTIANMGIKPNDIVSDSVTGISYVYKAGMPGTNNLLDALDSSLQDRAKKLKPNDFENAPLAAQPVGQFNEVSSDSSWILWGAAIGLVLSLIYVGFRRFSKSRPPNV
jgi:hypothetical protein